MNWFRNFSLFARAGFRVVAFDQPGFGRSAIPEDASLEFRYQHAEAFLRFLGAGSVSVISNSIGGLLATLLAHRLRRDRSLRVDALVAAAPFPYFPVSGQGAEGRAAHLARLGSVQATFESVQMLCRNTFFNPEFATDELVRFRLSMMQGDNWLAFTRRNQVGNAFDSRDLSEGTVDVPALIVWGFNDRSLPVDVGVEAMKRYINAEFLFLPHCGHWPQTEQAPSFNRAVLGFLEAQRETPAVK